MASMAKTIDNDDKYKLSILNTLKDIKDELKTKGSPQIDQLSQSHFDLWLITSLNTKR